MEGAGDIGEISVTFAAGVAAGTFLVSAFHNPTLCYFIGETFLTACLATMLVLHCREYRSRWLAGIIFFLSGMYIASISDISSVGINGSGLAMKAAGWATSLKNVMDSIPFRDEMTAPLLKALLTGDRSGLPGDIVRNFRTSGASHILALSGLHLGIIYIFIRRILFVIGNTPIAKIIRSLATISISGLYTLATGASPSLVRAFLFILLNESAHLLHRDSHPERVLCAALTLQLAINPGNITSPGFQLSYLAMGGILFLFPVLKSWFATDGVFSPMKKIWDAAVLAISCQVFTAPAAWYHFRTFPANFLITNLLALPVTSLLMTLAVPSVLLACLGECPGLLLKATEFLARTLLFIIEVISSYST
ncbi:MAG: ComEC/Rec2 family competence protein [Candidatus Cryptobacteroides sp.]